MPIVFQVYSFKKVAFLFLDHREIRTTDTLNNCLCENKCQLAVATVTLFCQECS